MPERALEVIQVQEHSQDTNSGALLPLTYSMQEGMRALPSSWLPRTLARDPAGQGPVGLEGPEDPLAVLVIPGFPLGALCR